MHPRTGATKGSGAKWGFRWFLLVPLICFLSEAARCQSIQGPDELRIQANEAYVQGDFLGALGGYERLVSLYPEEACLHGRLAGCALSEPGRLALVRRHLRIAIRKGCGDVDLMFHQARLAQLEYDFERAGDLYAAYLAAAGKKGRFREAALQAASICRAVDWDPAEAVALQVLERIPSNPDASFRYYDPAVPGIRLVSTPGPLRSKADTKVPAGRMALHDGDTLLVYASLGKKGATGLDLYRVSIRMGEYTEPVLLGGAVNTPFDEQDAYLSKDGLLYFSSNRPGGLGGFDIYAVNCGLNGVPEGEPYRLPYPINSVNDDQFFIPEEGGGAWMSSNRAAVEGRIHAYRLALGQGEMATGSVSWSRDEVASAGLRLRIFSEGEEVQSETLDADERNHLAFSAGEAVRVVLEDGNGHVVAESYGQGEGAWELRKGSKGWEFEPQSQMTTDWAVLSDVQVDNAPSDRDEGEMGLESEVGWNAWLADRLNSDMPSAEVGAAASVAVDAQNSDNTEDNVQEEAVNQAQDPNATEEPLQAEVADGRASDDAKRADDQTEVGLLAIETEGNTASGQGVTAVRDEDSARDRFQDAVEAEGLAGTSGGNEASEQSDTSVNGIQEAGATAEAVHGVPDPEVEPEDARPWTELDPNVLAHAPPEDEEQLEHLLEERPGVAIAIWEARTREVLELEADFLDSPDFATASTLYDQLDSLEAWFPRAELMDAALFDGLATDDIREMLDEWTVAVQSASKASLAEVAGEAALALRRERLAMRELQDEDGTGLEPLKRRWSDWRDARRGIPGVDAEAAKMTVGEGDGLMEDWNGLLLSSQTIWSRKQRNGWRGEWMKRQKNEYERFEEEWVQAKTEFDEAIAEESEGSEDDVAAVPAAKSAEGEGVSEPAGDSDPVELEVSGGNRFMLSVLFPEPNNGLETARSGSGQRKETVEIEQEWGAAVGESKDVDRAWKRLERALDGRSMPAVSDGRDWMALEPQVQQAYGVVMKATLDELEALCTEGRDARQATVDQANEWRSRDVPPTLAGERDTLLLELERLKAFDREWQALPSFVQGNGPGSEADFDSLQERGQRMKESASSWRSWEAEWNGLMLELELAAAEINADVAEAETTGAEESSLQRQPAANLEVPDEPVQESTDVPEDVAVVSNAGQEENGRADGQPSQQSDEIQEDSGNATPVTPTRETTANAPAPPSIEFVLSEAIGESEEEASGRLEIFRRLEGELAAGSTGFSPQVLEAAGALREFEEIENARPSMGAPKSDIQAWEKRRFFSNRRLQSSMSVLDLVALERKLAAIESSSDIAMDARPAELGLDEPANGNVTVADDRAEEPVRESDGAREEQDRLLRGYGIVLPEAEVLGRSTRGGQGLTLRPIEREEMERAVLVRSDNATETVSAAERFGREVGMPRAEGVEYKVQIGAFRNTLPAALFAAFDPMWAQSLPSGITRYMAGSFDLYDVAVDARDAIRALGYSDAFVVRFVDGERVVGSSRPDPDELALERAEPLQTENAVEAQNVAAVEAESSTNGSGEANAAVAVASIPSGAEEIPTWNEVQGRVFSVQIGAFRGVPDAAALADLGTLTREDASADGWLRLFSGRFSESAQAEAHRESLRLLGWSDAFIVVYINGRRIPLSQASTTAVSPLPGSSDGGDVRESAPPVSTPAPTVNTGSWYVELGVFNSTIPVRLANAILAAPLEWNITSVREAGLTRYVTGNTDRTEAEAWLNAARSDGFSNARLREK